jgi:NTE family protein
MTVAFVFGGGGRWGAVEVGMSQALFEAGVAPDLVVGSSIGALNGAMVAADPSVSGAARLRQVWEDVQESGLMTASAADRVKAIRRHPVALHDNVGLRELIQRALPTDRFEDLVVPFQCVGACIERSAEHWFSTGSLSEAILASSAIPGLFPPVRIDGETFYDGGLVNSVPVDRAVTLGATRIYVLQVGRIEQPLRPPTKPHEPALIAFEISRRHRYARAIDSLPEGVELHLLPSGNPIAFDDRRQLRWRDTADTGRLIETAHAATADYLRSGSP